MRAFRRLTSIAALLSSLLIAAGVRAAARQQPPPKDLLPLRVSLGDVDITKIVGVVALEEGIYRRNGLDVRQWVTAGAASVAKGSGIIVPREYVGAPDDRADVGIGGGTPLIVSVATDARSRDRVILGSLDHVVHWWIVARPGIRRLEDLKGKRLGFSGVGAMTHFIALELARRMKWDPVMDLSLMSNAIDVESLEQKRVDAIVCPGMALVEFRSKGTEPLADLRQTWGEVPIAGSGLTSTRTFVRQNPEAVRRFVKSIVDAIALMKRDRDVAFRAMTKWYGVSDREKLIANYRVADTLPAKPYPALAGIRKTMELYDSHEMRSHKPEDFYDDSFVKELDASGYIDSLYK